MRMMTMMMMIIRMKTEKQDESKGVNDDIGRAGYCIN